MSGAADNGRTAPGADGGRVTAPFGRRRSEVVANEESGGYRIVTALDPAGPPPAAGQFYMLTAERGWGGDGERPFLPRAFSVAAAQPGADGVRLSFLLEDVGPGTHRLAELEPGEGLHLTGPLGRPFSPPRELNPDAAGAILVGGGIGLAPLAIWRRTLAGRGIPERSLLGFRDREHSGGLELFRCSEVRLASEDGHAGHRGYVTDLLAQMLAGDSAATAVVYACGPPAMLEAVRALCEERGVTAELAMESPMACGYGACFGCAVPVRSGGYIRLCVDGPVLLAADIESALVAGAGHR
ncbi:MAG: dihydroorotate dehydrogenase electron transfer subunit [Solirubrobacterales bacterium]|nr:dihydroorotate dehydrogenase electron transfer subunit [Solirubrobacterales bacterium]